MKDEDEITRKNEIDEILKNIETSMRAKGNCEKEIESNVFTMRVMMNYEAIHFASQEKLFG